MALEHMMFVMLFHCSPPPGFISSNYAKREAFLCEGIRDDEVMYAAIRAATEQGPWGTCSDGSCRGKLLSKLQVPHVPLLLFLSTNLLQCVMMCYCRLIGESVDGIQLTTPACDLVDVPASDTEHTDNVCSYIYNSIFNRVGVTNFTNYVFHSTDNTNGKHPTHISMPHVAGCKVL
jgi:hypothetical protein